MLAVSIFMVSGVEGGGVTIVVVSETDSLVVSLSLQLVATALKSSTPKIFVKTG